MRRHRDNLTGASSVLYARRSKADPRNPGKSTGDQLDTQRSRAERLGLNVVREFTDDGIGASRHSKGKTRPGFVSAVEFLRDNPVEVFSLWELSRATRRLRVYSDLMELCEDRGTFLLVGDRVYDPLDPTDQMVLGMSAVTDAAEVARLRERTLRGVASVAAAGRPHGKNVYGYERIYDPRTRALVEVREHPEQGAVLREMVRRTIAGDSGRSIARDLNQGGNRKPSGTEWHASDVREMLTRRTYQGWREHHGSRVEAIWPAIISPDEAEALAVIFADRTRGVADTSAKHLLTGVAMCCRCDKPMYAETRVRPTHTQSYYRCQSCSRCRSVPHLEQYARFFVNGMLANPRTRRAIIGAGNPAADRARKQLGKLRAELDEAYTVGLSPRGLAAVEQRLIPHIEELERDLLNTPSASALTDVTCLPDSPDDARALLRRLVRVWVGPSRPGRGFDPGSVEVVPLGRRPLRDGE